MKVSIARSSAAACSRGREWVAAGQSVTVVDPGVVSAGSVLRSTGNGFAVSIEAGCNGVEATIVLVAAMFVMGLGHGLVTPLVMAGAYRDLPKVAIAGATIAASIMIRVGSALGAAILAVVLQILIRHAGSVPTTGAALAPAFAHSFWWAFGIAAITLVPALLVRDR